MLTKIILLFIAIYLTWGIISPKIEPAKSVGTLNYIYPQPPKGWRPEGYTIDGKWYSIWDIARAVQRREGHNSCGIKLQGQYVTLNKEDGLKLCAEKLGKQIDRYGFEKALMVWKSVPPFEPYIKDIKWILAG